MPASPYTGMTYTCPRARGQPTDSFLRSQLTHAVLRFCVLLKLEVHRGDAEMVQENCVKRKKRAGRQAGRQAGRAGGNQSHFRTATAFWVENYLDLAWDYSFCGVGQRFKTGDLVKKAAML